MAPKLSRAEQSLRNQIQAEKLAAAPLPQSPDSQEMDLDIRQLLERNILQQSVIIENQDRQLQDNNKIAALLHLLIDKL